MIRRYVYALAPLAASALWGGMYVVAKWGFSVVPPITLSSLRVAIAAPVLLGLVWVTKPRRGFSWSERCKFVALGVAVTVTLVTQFIGTELTNASQSSLVTVLTPVFTLVLGILVLGEPLTRYKASGMAIALAGTALVLGGQYDPTAMAGGSVAGILGLLAASFAWAAYTVWGRGLVRKYSALETTTYATVAATPMLLVLVPIELATRDVSVGTSVLHGPFLLAVGYLGMFGTAAAWYLWYKGLEYADSGTVATFFVAQPVVGSALGAVVLGEQLGPLFFVGGAVMAVGVVVVSASTGPDAG